ncbi:MAG: hypothetical protein E4G96_08380, partial [Chrysiogenales bacterium]
MKRCNKETGEAVGGFDRNVVIAGITSFFTDIASEMIYPLIQAFVAMIMIAQKALVGPVLG